MPKVTRRGVSAGTQAALKTGFPKKGLSKQAAHQAASLKETASLKPGHMTERIMGSPKREPLLTARFGKTLGGMIEKSPNKFNLTRGGLTAGVSHPKRKKRAR